MQFDIDSYYSVDGDAIECYNKRRRPGSRTRLQVHMGPAPFDGDPHAAKIVLLLNNPMFAVDSNPSDHGLQFDGWPLAGLHPSVRQSFRQWYYRPLGHLIKTHGAQLISQRVAIVQIIPWASIEFDGNCNLPSRDKQVSIARQAVERGALVIIGRSEKFWKSRLGSAPNIYTAASALNPTISPRGLGMTHDAFDTLISPLLR